MWVTIIIVVLWWRWMDGMALTNKNLKPKTFGAEKLRID